MRIVQVSQCFVCNPFQDFMQDPIVTHPLSQLVDVMVSQNSLYSVTLAILRCHVMCIRQSVFQLRFFRTLLLWWIWEKAAKCHLHHSCQCRLISADSEFGHLTGYSRISLHHSSHWILCKDYHMQLTPEQGIVF